MAIALTESGPGSAEAAAGGRRLALGRPRRAALRFLRCFVAVIALVGVAAGPASAAQWDPEMLGKVLRIAPAIEPASMTGTEAPRSEPDPNFKVLDLASSSGADGAAIQTWNANDTEAQRWYLEVAPESVTGSRYAIAQGYAIRNIRTGKCLDVEGGFNAEGTRVIQWSCHWGFNQLWRPSRDGYLRSLVNITRSDDYSPLFGDFAGPGLKLGMRDGDPAIITYGTPTRLSFDESGYWTRTPTKVLEGWACYPTACSNGVSSTPCQGGYVAGGRRNPWIQNVGSDTVSWYGSWTAKPPVLSSDNRSLSGFYHNRDTSPRTGAFRVACFTP
jgi:Ricin-type beta-trefoil lectin domain-like